MLELRPYQVEALNGLARNASGLLADDMGLGKTLVAVEHVKRLKYNKGARILWIGPLNTHQSVRKTFLSQFKSLADRPELVRICGTPSTDIQNWRAMMQGKSGVYIIGWEAMRGTRAKDSKGNLVIDMRNVWQRTGTWDVVVADECHRIQNRKSQTKEVIASINTRHKLALSGTPAGNKPEGIWSVYNWLWKEEYPAFWPWVNKYLVTTLQTFRGRRVRTIEGEKYSGAIFNGAPCVVRRLASDVFDQLPEVATHEVLVPMTKAQRRIYEDFERQAFAWLKDQPVATPLPLVQRLRLRQTALAEPSAIEIEETGEQQIFFDKDTPAPKIDALKEILSDIPDTEPVLVFTHSRKFAEIVAYQLGKAHGKIALWSGSVKQKERQEIMENFGHKYRVLVAVISAIGEGTDGLQRVCANEVWLSQDDNNLMNQQAEARLNRSGQERLINRWYVRTEATIDERIYERLEENREQMSLFYRDIGQESYAE